MVDNRKEQERTELHRTIWGIANDLRGSVDSWEALLPSVIKDWLSLSTNQ